MWIFYFFRNLNKEQLALVKAYAELDKDAVGTIEGITSTSTGKVFFIDINFFMQNILEALELVNKVRIENF